MREVAVCFKEAGLLVQNEGVVNFAFQSTEHIVVLLNKPYVENFPVL